MKSSKKIYRVIASNSTVDKEITSSSVKTEVIYNNRKPVYASNNLEDASQVFNQLVDEDYSEHMLLIVDFGMMPLGERMRQSLSKSNCGTKLNELIPYVTIYEYHRGIGTLTNAPEITISMADGNVERGFHSMKDAMRFFETRLYNAGNMRMSITEHVTDCFSGKKHTETRTLVNSKEFKCTDSYHPCRKIRIIEERYLSLNKDNINLDVAC